MKCRSNKTKEGYIIQPNREESSSNAVSVDRRAGGFIRMLAFFYDLVVLAMVLFMFGAASTLWMMVSTDSPFISDPVGTREFIFENEFHLYLINWVVLGSVFLFYQYIYPMFKRQTIGMQITDITIVDEHERKISKIKYVQRELLKILLCPGFFFSFGKDKRALYDKLSNTYLMK
ncbi:hypothetical protein CR194_05675 [Salipaludibacillus keqinensis]|uniref:RDD domain-containing protein n=1 Tax=Salipaludibacillus keqinensis TaxID=2045207 RepID=A0A323TLY5_9BACI|nr:RDD family protein [Salipaludibacillus keqinensis]PYZ95004.1 hypothetical protein CR194_05675 [Salipaludibacillus keqinensis]